MVDETVFWCIVLGLQRTEQRLLSTEDLDGTCWVLRKAEETAGVADQTSSDKVSDEGGEVGCDGVHAIPEVLCELRAVGGDGDDLVAQRVDVRHIRF